MKTTQQREAYESPRIEVIAMEIEGSILQGSGDPSNNLPSLGDDGSAWS